MKTTLIPANPPAYEEVEVGCGFALGSVFIRWSSGGTLHMREFDPAEAAKIHRVLMGELDEACPKDGSKDVLRISWHERHDGTDEWRFGIVDGETFFTLNSDQALALAWSLEGACAAALYWAPPGQRFHVWVLSSKRMLTGDSAANGAEQIGGTERVFLKKEKALDELREFLRVLVNQSYPEHHFEEMAEDGVSRDVDDVLDEIMDQSGNSNVWTHDGMNQSFEVTLNKVEVEA